MSDPAEEQRRLILDQFTRQAVPVSEIPALPPAASRLSPSPTTCSRMRPIDMETPLSSLPDGGLPGISIVLYRTGSLSPAKAWHSCPRGKGGENSVDACC
jgi:hypothetical protein